MTPDNDGILSATGFAAGWQGITSNGYIVPSVNDLAAVAMSGDAADLTGTIADAQLSSSVTLLTGTQTLTNKTLTNPLVGNGTVTSVLTSYASNILSIANSTSACGLNIWATRTDASNYEKAFADWSTNASTFTIGTTKAGTGTARVLRLQGAAQVDVYSYDSVQSARFGTSAVIYVPLLWVWNSKAGDPTTSDVASTRCGVWKNTTSGAVKLWVNDGGTMKSVALA